MKRFMMLALAVFLCLRAAPFAAAPKPDTRWYTANPGAATFTISTANQLAGLAQIVNGTWGGTPARDDFSGKTIRLAKNINLVVDTARNIIANKLEDGPLTVYDELKYRLKTVKERYGSIVSDGDDIIITAEKGVSCDKIARVADVARGAGYPNIRIAALRGDDDDDEWVPPPPPLPDRSGGAAPAPVGGRSRASIQNVVTQNMSALRYAYNRLLRDKPGSAGKVTIKFAIDEHGKIIFARTAESTMNDPEFDGIVVETVKKWEFGPIDKPGDVTEVTYPFIFSE